MQPSDYQVAVPSWRRADLLRDKTLTTLRRGGVSMSRLTVFINMHDPQLNEYLALAEAFGFDIQSLYDQGINATRRRIADHFPPGTPVVCMDDDVTRVARAVSPKKLDDIGDLGQFFADAFQRTSDEGLQVWGVNAVANPYFMQGKTTTDLKFLIATLWGFYSRPGHPVHATTVEVKEDYESSLRAWWYDGGLVRFSNVTAVADHYRAAGGCQDYRDAARSQEAAERLIADWPGLVRINTRRKSGHAEVLLARKARHEGHPVDTAPPGYVAV
jgi:hypothetical protein